LNAILSMSAKERSEFGTSTDAPRLDPSTPNFSGSKHYRPNSQQLLFANRRGRPYSANELREKRLRPLLVTPRIPLGGFHAFRRGVATALIDRGASITTVGAQLRQSDPRITLRLYAHVVPQSQRDAVERLASALSSSQRAASGNACTTTGPIPTTSFSRPPTPTRGEARPATLITSHAARMARPTST